MSHGNTTLVTGFARAIFELALEPWLSALDTMRDTLVANHDLGPRLDDKALPFDERKKLLDEILPANTTETIRNFFYTLVKDGNMHLLDDIKSHLLALMTQAAHIRETIVTTAVALSDDEKQAFREKLMAKYGDNLDVRFKVDPKIIGGVIVQVGDKILDGSVAAKLNAVETTFKSVS